MLRGMVIALVMSASWSAMAATITDADTVIVGGVTYRLDGIDAPEPEQVCQDAKGVTWFCGAAAREALARYLGARVVACEDRGQDPAYKRRRIGICRVEGEKVTINQWMVQQGLAVNFEPYGKGRYKIDEQLARDGLQGMWAGCFAAPRDFRRGNRETAELLGGGCPTGDAKGVRLALFPLHPNEPPGCPIKATTAMRARVMGWSGIFYVPGCRNYAKVKEPQRWFCAASDAKAAGFRKAWTC